MVGEEVLLLNEVCRWLALHCSSGVIFYLRFILRCVRWYCRYSLSYREVEELSQERGLRVDHSTVYRWAQAYSPQLDKRC